MSTLRKAVQDYDEFEVVLSPREHAGVFQVRAQSAVGSAAGEFRLPVAPDEWPRVRRQLTQVVLAAEASSTVARAGADAGAVARGTVDLSNPGASPLPALSHRTFGVELFNALFAGDIRTLFERARQHATEQRRAGIRVRLTFSFTDDTAGWFSGVLNLPWELMATSEAENPLVINSQSPLVRSFDRIMQPLDVIEPPIRLLVISASPAGTQALAVDTEVARMQAQWSRAPAVQFRARPARLEVVAAEMEQFNPHIVHFIGHGDVVQGRGVLLFDRDGAIHQMDASALSGLFARDSLRLVYLNSCRGAEVGHEEDSSPFAGVATSLAKNRVPAVIAMQFPVTDSTAIAFCDSFYGYLVQGYPLDTAVSAARRAVFARGTREWATPVLFLREPDAQLIRRPSAAQLHGLAPFETRGLVEILAPDPAAVATDAAATAAGDDEPFVAFLASATRSVDKWLARAQAEMLRLGWTVVRVTDPTWPDYAPLFQQLTRCCHLFVHIVGPRPGDEIAEVPDTEAPYHAVQQFNLAFASAASQLVIFPRGTPRTSGDPHLAAMLESIEVSRREQSQFESVECDIERLADQLHAHYLLMQQTELEAAGAVTATREAVFVDVHDADIDAARPLLAMLDRLGVTYLLSSATRAQLAPPSSAAPAVERPAASGEVPDPLAEFQSLVRQVPLMIVAAGLVNPVWVSGRLREGIKAAIQREEPTTLAVLRLPGNTSAPVVPSFARLFGNDEGFTEQTLRDLLALRSA